MSSSIFADEICSVLTVLLILNMQKTIDIDRWVVEIVMIADYRKRGSAASKILEPQTTKKKERSCENKIVLHYGVQAVNSKC